MKMEELIKEIDIEFKEKYTEIQTTKEEERLIKLLYRGFLIGHWSAHTSVRRSFFWRDEKVIGGGNTYTTAGINIAWWYHVAKGLLEIKGSIDLFPIAAASEEKPKVPENIMDIIRSIATQ